MMKVIEELTEDWKACDYEIVVLESEIRRAYATIKRLDAKIESIQAQIALLQEQE
tara:strand:+ start:440 stop:604 length:165 start_codon:yes stop_codon:yes gene_type:complete